LLPMFCSTPTPPSIWNTSQHRQPWRKNVIDQSTTVYRSGAILDVRNLEFSGDRAKTRNLRRSNSLKSSMWLPACLLRNKCADCKVVVVSSLFYSFFLLLLSHCS
jgi:hypothetical protein